ncbi:unnamed protein product [Urochloa decumbens]|uniref:Neprosin PEP catalytic domain-containing protein n=1 Tax=Urochloa decumbens TaxID=240449 RepID=A0ABC9B2S2_9POAL
MHGSPTKVVAKPSSMAATTQACLVALLVALAFVFLELDGAAAGSAGQQGLQVQNLLSRLNKAPVASIQSRDGDIIDCVHISKQPAFDHPSLKNHTIQMRPSYHPGALYNGSNIAPHPITQTWYQNGKCPENTVPIRRTREEDVLRASSVERYGKKRPDSSVTTGHQYAEAYAPGGKYYGTKMTINLWQPTINKANDFSLTQTWVTAGSYQNNDLNTIEAGWQVYPAMYGDDNTRLFIYWTRDAYGKTGCYNLCAGFVQTNNQFAIGGSLSPVSTYGGSQYEINILIWKDQNSGNWWLQVGGSDLGYWPSSIFTHLADSASAVSWGGEVDSPDSSTPMGSGHFPDEGFSKASYIRNIQVVGSSNNLESLNAPLGLLATQPNYYNVKSTGANSNWGTYIFYGGPGNNPS